MKRTLPLFLALVFAGCQGFEGQMNALKPFEAIAKNGAFGRAKTIVVPTGTHSVSVETGVSSATISLELSGKKEAIVVKVPRNRIPKEQGGFEVLASESGQPFDMLGNLDIDHTRSRRYRDQEACSRTVPREVCGYDSEGRWYCMIDYVTVYGRQEVEYYNLSTRRHLDVRLSNPADTNDVLATLDGHDTTVDKVYTYQGHCY